MRRLVPVLLLCVFGAGPRAALAEDTHRGSKVALAEILIAAAQAGDEVDAEKALATYGGDVLELGYDVLAAYWRSTTSPDVPPQLALTVVERIAALTDGRPTHASLAKALHRWGSLSEAEWGRERRMALGEQRLSALHRMGLHRSLRRAAELVRQDEALAEGSLFTWRARRYRGFALGAVGDLEGSRSAMRTAGNQAMQAGWYPQAARSFSDAGRLSKQLRQPKERAGDERSSWEAARASGDPAQITRMARVFAATMQAENRYAACIPILEEAREAARRRAKPRDRYDILRMLRSSYRRQGRHEEAIAVAREFGAFARTLEDEVRRQEALYLEGTELFSAGHLAQSLSRFEQAAAMRPKKGDAHIRLDVLNRLSATRSMLGNARGGLAAAEEAINIAVAHGWKHRESESRYYAAGAHWRLGELEQSEKAARAALALLDPAKDVIAVAEIGVHLGQVAERRQQWSVAEAHYQQALAMYERHGDTALTRGVRIVRAALELHRGRPQQALERLDALRSGTPLGFLDRSLVESFYARAAIRAGRHEDARSSARTSLEEHLRSFEGLAARDTLERQSRTGTLSHVGLHACAELLKAPGAKPTPLLEDAFWFLEVGRALNLVQALRHVEGGVPLPAELVEADAESRALLRRARSRWTSVATRASSTETERTGARGDLESAWRARDEVVRRIERTSRRAGLLARVSPAKLNDLRAALGSTERFVAYACSSSRIFALTASRESVHLHDLGDVGDTSELVERLRRRLSAPGASSKRLSQQLHARLVEPLAKDLEGATRLLVSPDPILAAVPFAALQGEDGRYVVQAHEVMFVPSATAHLALRKRKRAVGAGLFALANPPTAPLLPALPGSEAEVTSLAAHFPDVERHLLLGKDANLTRVRKVLANTSRTWRVAHFACHGVLDPRHPERSGLVLAGPEVWTADSVAASRVASDLVVLSACNTARGVPALGEGLLGLGRAFLWAGAGQVVASAWRVEDGATAVFFAHFYAAHLKDGLDPVAALRAAQLAVMRMGGAGADPSRWAAFVLWG